MADNQPGLYLIAYDIADPKRLSRVHRALKREGLPVQYSVFTVVIKRKALLRLMGVLIVCLDSELCINCVQSSCMKCLKNDSFKVNKT